MERLVTPPPVYQAHRDWGKVRVELLGKSIQPPRHQLGFNGE